MCGIVGLASRNRITEDKDPSVGANADEWIDFMTWVGNRIEESGVYERRKAWIDARAEYFANKNRLTATLRTGIGLLQSGHASTLMWENLFGSSLPRRLAQEWMQRS